MRLRLCAGALSMLLLAPLPSAASNFVVTPTEIDLSTSATSALLTLRNVSKAPLRFEVTLFTWSEDEHGVMTLEPSTDVTFFPKLIELGAGTSRNIRLGINAGASRDVERSFRIFVEELPDQSAPKTNGVAIRTKVGVPVFVRPAKPTRSAVIDGVSVAGGKVLTRVHNTGNLHLNVDTVAVKGIGRVDRGHVHQGRRRLVRASRRDASLRGADVRRGMPVDHDRRRGSVRARPVPQGRESGVAGCVRCALGTIVGRGAARSPRRLSRRSARSGRS